MSAAPKVNSGNSASTSSTTNEVITNNLSVSGNQGLTVAGNDAVSLGYDASTTANLYDASKNDNSRHYSDSRSYDVSTTDSHNVSNANSNNTNISNTYSDEGAIKAGQAIAYDSLNFADNLSSHALDVANASSSRDFTLASNFATGAADFAGALTSQVIKFVGAEAQNQAMTLGNTVSALNAVAKENSTSSDQRIADIASSSNASQAQVVKYALAGIAVVGGIYLLNKRAV